MKLILNIKHLPDLPVEIDLSKTTIILDNNEKINADVYFKVMHERVVFLEKRIKEIESPDLSR